MTTNAEVLPRLAPGDIVFRTPASPRDPDRGPLHLARVVAGPRKSDGTVRLLQATWRPEYHMGPKGYGYESIPQADLSFPNFAVGKEFTVPLNQVVRWSEKFTDPYEEVCRRHSLILRVVARLQADGHKVLTTRGPAGFAVKAEIVVRVEIPLGFPCGGSDV